MLAAEAAGKDGQARDIRSTFEPLRLGVTGAAGEQHDGRVSRV
jgi:hypothetical protein